MPEISNVTSTIAFFGTIIGICAASFQVLDQIEKRRDAWFKKLHADENDNLKSALPQPTQILPNILPNECHVDWGEAVDVSVFYGRAQELATLEEWIINDNCRLIVLLGMGGIGKTSLSVKLAQKLLKQKLSSL
ncbi:WD-repeat protein [Calothrix sp. NIES-4071]|nr:WD-repeat protein [Calothrix sp. NIES-4071]BAZ57098.1 WD-repeat protein [Calothrix sp. NIES-4105]